MVIKRTVRIIQLMNDGFALVCGIESKWIEICEKLVQKDKKAAVKQLKDKRIISCRRSIGGGAVAVVRKPSLGNGTANC